ncbi:MAG: hypothetical protein JWR02_2925 [Mucilaginibacter sp.]|nr:hypothetical protein [Mucilaginibacter sp.]
MKKNNIYISMVLTVLVTIITSCQKLNLVPVFEIPVNQSFSTVKDAKAWDGGMYALLRNRQFGQYLLESDVATDELNATLDYGNNYGSPQRWDNTFLSTDQNLSAMWNAYYSNIANINTAIAGFPSIATPAASDVTSMNQYTGDAHLMRAWYYHKLVLRWAKPYETATAATDPGVPLVLKFNLTELPARASVQAVYTQILSDITQAETLLANVPGVQGSPYFTIDAARALEARVKLDMHDYAGAYAAANTLITGGKYPLITTQAGMISYWKNDGGQESITQLFVNNTSEAPTSMINYIQPKTATNYDPLYVPTQTIIDMFGATDIRKAAYFSSAYPVVIQGTPYPGIFIVAKYQGNPALFTTALTNALQAPKIFRIAEMYLIAAEASASASSEPNALTALNALRVARGEVPSVSTGAALVQDIRDERRRELAFEGFRLDDLKRWHLGFTRGVPQNTNMLLQGSSYVGLTIAADANFFTWGIPFGDTSINPNLVQNPGWQ